MCSLRFERENEAKWRIAEREMEKLKSEVREIPNRMISFTKIKVQEEKREVFKKLGEI